MRRAVFFIAFAFLFSLLFSPLASASEAIETEYSDFFGALPESAVEDLPDSVNGADPVKDAEVLTDWRYLFSALSDMLGEGMRRTLPILCTLCGLLLTAAAVEAMRSALSFKFGNMISACVGCAVCAAAVTLQYETIAGAAEYLRDLCTLVNALLPLTLSLYAAGGNIAAASVSAGAFGIFLNFCENLLTKSIMPFAGVCLAFAVCSAVSSHIDLRPLTAVIKKTYTTALTFLMSIFCAVLAAQNAIASGADSLSLRAARFVAGSAIPILGGAVGESMKTFSASVGLLRKSIGVTGMILVILLFLPRLLSLLMMRTVNGVASGFAALLGCRRESELLAEISGVYGYISAVLCACSMMFVFILTLLVGAVSVT